MVDIIDEIKEIVEDGEEAVEELVHSSGKKSKSGAKKSSKKDIEKEAEAESTTGVADIESRKKALLEKVKKLKEKVKTGEISSEELKEQVKVKKKDMLIPL